MLNSPSLYYEESGKVPPIGPVLALFAGSVAAAILSFVYAYAINYIPFIYLNFFLTIGLGGVVGFSVAQGARIGKVRNRKVVVGLSVLASLVACYFSWVFTVNLWIGMDSYLFNPLDLWTIIQIAAVEGVWTIKSSTPTGAALYVVWAIEAGIIIGVAGMAGLGTYPSEPFCESCNTWTEAVELTNRLGHPESFADFVKELEAKKFDALTVLRNVDAGEAVHLKVELLNCSSCSRVHYLTITLIVATVNDDGKVEEKETLVLDNMRIEEKIYQELMVWQKKLDEKPPVAEVTEVTTDTAETTEETEEDPLKS